MSLVIIHTVLLLLLCIAAYQDYHSYIISNILVVSGALLGVMLNYFLPAGIGFINSLAGLGVGLLLLLPLYLLRVMGAGDIKLMAMVGAFIGPQAVLISILYIMITGGVLAICVAIYRGVLKSALYRVLGIPIKFIVNLFASKSNHTLNSYLSSEISYGAPVKIPYGIAIAIGTAIFLAVHQSAIYYTL
jgi:prepilin peptidase CpaA